MNKFASMGPNIIGGVGNSILRGDGFYISHNAATGTGLPHLAGMFAGDGSGEETALVKDGKFYILNGDWRKEYAALAPKGWNACLAFFEEHREQCGSSWTSDGV